MFFYSELEKERKRKDFWVTITLLNHDKVDTKISILLLKRKVGVFLRRFTYSVVVCGLVHNLLEDRYSISNRFYVQVIDITTYNKLNLVKLCQ